MQYKIQALLALNWTSISVPHLPPSPSQLSMGMALHGIHLSVKTTIGHDKGVLDCSHCCQFLTKNHTHMLLLLATP